MEVAGLRAVQTHSEWNVVELRGPTQSSAKLGVPLSLMRPPPRRARAPAAGCLALARASSCSSRAAANLEASPVDAKAQKPSHFIS